MKRILFLALLMGGFQLKSQTATITSTLATSKLMDNSAIKTNVQRYKIDYEIKEWVSNPLVNVDIDTEKLNQLDLNYYDSKRKQSEDYEEYDTKTGLTVIVYSIQRMTANQPQ